MGLFERNLNKYGKPVTLQSRGSGIVNGLPTETFTDVAVPTMPVKAIISTVTGVSIFDDTNTEQIVTHKLCLAYIGGITAENWVLFGSKRIRILDVENVCEAGRIMILMCTERGDNSKVVNQA